MRNRKAANRANNQHTIRVTSGDLQNHRNGETLIMTFATYKAALAAYRAMPAGLWATWPERVQTVLYRDHADAVADAVSFFA